MIRWAKLLFLLFATTGPARAATYFVRQAGNDDHSGLYPSQAWQSLPHAVQLLKPGDTLIVGAGKYVGRVRFTQNAAEQPITVIADRAGRLTGDVGEAVLTAPGSWVLCFDGATDIQVRGLTIQGRTGGLGCWVRESERITLQDCSIADAQTGVRVDGPGNLLMERCVTRKCKESGIVLMKAGSALLRACEVTDNGKNGVLVSSEKEKLEIHRSRIAGNGKTGLRLHGSTLAVNCLIDGNEGGVVIDADQVTLLHLTVADNRGHGIEHEKGDDVTIANSIVAYQSGVGIYSHPSNADIVANVVMRNRGGDVRGIEMPTTKSSEKLFVDKKSYRLAAKSPALNAGITVELTEDMVGNPRSLGGGFDAGCLEFVRAEPHVYYVTPRGDDENDGKSPRFAWQTIHHALQQVVAGDVVYVGGGEYVEDLIGTRRGTSERPITFIADTKGAKTGVAGPVTIAAKETAWSWQLLAADYTRIIGFQFVPASQPKIKPSKPGGMSIREAIGVELVDCAFTKLENGLLAEWSEVTLERCRWSQIRSQAATVTKGLLTARKCRFERSGVGVVCLRDAMIDATECAWTDNVRGGLQCAGRAQLAECTAERNGGAGLLIDGADHRLLNWKKLIVRGNRDFGISFNDCLLQLDKAATKEWKVVKNGCAVGVRGGSLAIEQTELPENGRAALVAEQCQLVLRDVRLAGGVELRGVQKSLLERCRIIGTGAGHGVLATASDFALRTCLIQDFSIGVDLAASDPPNRAALWNATIVNCAAHGIVRTGGDLLLKNSIVCGLPKSQRAVRLGEYGTFEHSHNLFFGFDGPLEGAALVATEIVGNPRFAAPDQRDFRLATASPGINAGVDAKELSALDLSGHERPQHRAWDLGALEFQDDNGSLRILQWKEKR